MGPTLLVSRTNTPGAGGRAQPLPQMGTQSPWTRRQELGCELMWLSTAAQTMAGEAGGVGMAGPGLGPGHTDVLVFITWKRGTWHRV